MIASYHGFVCLGMDRSIVDSSPMRYKCSIRFVTECRAEDGLKIVDGKCIMALGDI